MITKLLKSFANALEYLFELILSISLGRKPQVKKGKKEFVILVALILLGFIGYYSRINNICLNCNDDKNNESVIETLKSDDFLPKEESTNSATTEEIDYSNLYLVTRVVDGDTFMIATGETVRLIGVDTPETVHPTKPVGCYGPEASNFLKNLIENREVRLEKDISNTDQYNRLLRYVYLDNMFINEYLVNEGYAKAVTYPPDVTYQEVFQSAETSAREAQRGLWGAECLETTEEIEETDDTSCQIKGNISWSGQKLYHLPECPYYEATVINELGGEKYFCTEQEAILAGWEKAGNCP